MDAAFEIAIARQHGHRGQAARSDRIIDFIGQRAGTPHASHAAKTAEVKPKEIKGCLQAALSKIVRHHARPGRQRGLDPGPRAQAARKGIARHEPGADHHRGIGGVGATGDRGDHHIAILQTGTMRAARLHLWKALAEGGARRVQRHPILRAAWACDTGFHGRQVDLDDFTEIGVRRLFVAPHALGLAVGFHQRHLCLIAPGLAQIAQGLGIHREKAHGRTILRAHIGNRCTIRQGQFAKSGAKVFNELANQLVPAKDLRDGQHHIGRGHTRPQLADDPHARHLRDQHRYGLTQGTCATLQPADAPAEHPQGVDHWRVAIHAEHRVGVGKRQAIDLARPHHACQVL